MNPDRARMLEAFIEVYNEFSQIYTDWTESFWEEDNWDINEQAKLFEIAWNDSILGELLRDELIKKYRELTELERQKEEMEEEAEAGEAMII